jgi:hypothetical protein
MSTSSILTELVFGLIKPIIVFNKMLLPVPEEPIITKVSRRRLQNYPQSTCFKPNRLWTFSIFIIIFYCYITYIEQNLYGVILSSAPLTAMLENNQKSKSKPLKT